MQAHYMREAHVIYRPVEDSGRLYSPKVRVPADAYAALRPVLENLITESLVVLALNTRGGVLGYHEVSRGGVDQCSVAVADVFRWPLLAGSRSIVVAHNHPSGESSPSPEDIELTKRIREGADLLGIQLLDHLVVGFDEYTSFAERGLL